MYYKTHEDNLIVKSAPEAEEINIPLGEFSFITSICPHPDKNALSLTGIAKGAELPSLKHNRKGDLRLYKIRLGESTWECLYANYAHDPAPIPGTDQIAFHTGNGISVIDNSGRLVYHARLGQFNWGAPSVSASPHGKRVAFIKWQGDHQKVGCITLADQDLKRYKPACYRYTWFDDDYILYGLGSGLKLLNLDTHKSRLFVRNLASEATMGFECEQPELADFILSDKPKEYMYSSMRCIDDTVYFNAVVTTSEFDKAYHALFSMERNRRGLKLLYLARPTIHIHDFEIDRRGNILLELERYEKMRVVERLSIPIGPDQDFLRSGWKIFRESIFPEFGFHYLGEFDQPQI